MSANIDSMMYVGETPWHGLGTRYEEAPQSSEEIVKGANLDWTVSAHEMSTDIDTPVPGYHGIYRDDDNRLLGVVKSYYPQIVQNVHTFEAFDAELGNSMNIETAASLGRGETIFGCFKFSEEFKVLDDNIAHYFVVMNEHLKPDGKVTILNTPVRVVCQNTLSHALSNSVYKVRIPFTDDPGINQEMLGRVLSTMQTSIQVLRKKAETWVDRKVDRDHIDTILDELFPYPDKEDPYSEKNAGMQMERDQFIECMSADNLANYRGTVYQVFNALTDYTQHYYKKAEKGFDLNYRMSMLPGMGTDTPANKVAKFIKLQNKMFA